MILALCALCVGPSVIAAAAQEAGASVEHLYFVGAVAGAEPKAVLDGDDIAFLLACREPSTLTDVLSQGIPFRAARIQQFQSWGLLVQRRQTFQTLMPVWLQGSERAIDAALDQLAGPIANAIAPQLGEIQAQLRELGHESSMPALVSWLVRERAWNKLQASGIIDVPGYVQRLRESYPDRDWWGVIWFDEQGPGSLQHVATQTSNDRTMLMAWRPDLTAGPLDVEEPYTWLGPLVGAVRNDRLEVRSPDRFDTERDAGLIDDDRISAPLIEWDPEDEEGLAAKVEQTVELLVLTVAAQLAGSWAPADMTTVDPVATYTVAYTGLVPRLLSALQEQGVRALIPADAPLLVTRSVRDEDGEETVQRRPGRVSVFFWKELPRESTNFALPY